MQSDLDKIYEWTDQNNMELNDLKFELLQYGHNEDIKMQAKYTSPSGTVIETKDAVKDLGVYMSNDCSFKKQIEHVIEKAKNITSWILRSFSSRSKNVMLTLYKTLVIPILEYCSVLWNPNVVSLIQRLEDVQQSFLKKINGAQKNYWECIKCMNVYSLQRRRERYRIIYIWKIFEGLVPNINGKIISKENPRLGRFCCLPQIPTQRISKFQEATLSYQGTRLFNSMPKHIRNMKNVTIGKFKRTLDLHLKTIPDEPQIKGYTGYRRANTNSLIDMKNLC